MIAWAWAGGSPAAGPWTALLSPVAAGGAEAASDAAQTISTASVVWLTLGIGAPILIAPLVVMGLRPLYALFLREAAEVFTETYLDPDLFRAVAHYMAIINVILFVLMWEACFACQRMGSHHLWTCLIVVAGIAGAIAITVWLVGRAVGLRGRTAFYVGLVMFGGGNLPVFIVVPTIMAFV